MKNIILSLSLIIFIMTASVAQQKPASSGYAPVNGLKIYYETYGEGAPLVLLHGAFMTIGTNWSQLIPELAKTHKVIAVEMQGHGRTADIDRPYSYTALADDVAGLLKYLNIKKTDVIGYSFGAPISYQMAIAHPQLVGKLVIISGVYKRAGWLPQVQQAISGITPEVFASSPIKQVYDSLAPNPSHWAKFITKMVKFAAEDFDLGEDNIKHLSSPVLLIMGDNDGVDLQYTARTYQLLGGGIPGDMAAMPKSQLAIIAGASHVGLMGKTEILSGLILPFLSK
ncbi:alpha/beta hydrolase [Pedobacter sp. HDW13]|uniref:alpha/beta fold hydrolase n=1 Tax=unclassified Pedobacter TaxID=2628915 RepID=UPI000F599069|nr:MULTISPECIES: alpha/beta hydrolase [unclassified Pedobacter]QIL41831.1 alpha/beta hydrolase [Pedobacter sp. HDW13]RQO73389.1 alpha/beta hydrolase [Pedobacter sp. KBW01]